MIESAREGDPLAYWRLKRIDRRTGSALMEFYLSPGWRGEGLGWLLMNACVDHAFSTLGLRRLWGISREDNRYMFSIVKRMGFTVEGKLRRHFLVKGKPMDAVVVACLREEWPGLPPHLRFRNT
jgi:RimJ/RimL family protein N-acetyltransferase